MFASAPVRLSSTLSAVLMLLSVVACSSTPEPPPLVGAERELTFTSAGTTLEGTLTVPTGKGPFPVVVLVHGSGPNGRDEVLQGQLNMGFGFKLSAFRDIAYGLAKRGVATYRYDKRTCGPFSNCPDNQHPKPPDTLTVNAFVDDANAAAAMLRSLPDIDPQRVFVVGHSQGGGFMPQVLANDPALAGGVSLAGNFNAMHELIEMQYEFSAKMFKELELPEFLADKQLKPLKEMVDDTKAIAAGTYKGEGPVGGAPVTFWKSTMSLNASKKQAALDVAQPMLFVGGGYDWNVPSSELNAWKAHLQGKTNVEYVEFDCVTHALNCVSQPDHQKISKDEIGPYVDDRVIDAVAAFVKKAPVKHPAADDAGADPTPVETTDAGTAE